MVSNSEVGIGAGRASDAGRSLGTPGHSDSEIDIVGRLELGTLAQGFVSDSGASSLARWPFEDCSDIGSECIDSLPDAAPDRQHQRLNLSELLPPTSASVTDPPPDSQGKTVLHFYER